MMVSRPLAAAIIAALAGSVPAHSNPTQVLSGKVTLEDGSPPGKIVAILRACGDKPEHVGDTNTKGEYSFHNIQSRGLNALSSLTSASAGGVTIGALVDSTARRAPCVLRASLAGYQSNSVEIEDQAFLISPIMPTLILARRGSVVSFDDLESNVPHAASGAWDRANKEIQRRNWAGAEEQLRAVVAAAPKFAAGWEMLGNVTQFTHQASESRKAYENALANNPRLLQSYLMLARLEIDAKDWQALDATSAGLAKADLKQLYPEAYVYQAVARYHLNDFERAAASAESAIRVDKKHEVPLSEYVYGLILESRRDYPGAKQHLTRFLDLDPKAPEAPIARARLENLGKPQPEDRAPDVAAALEGVAASLKLEKTAQAWVPGGIAAFSAIAHLGANLTPQNFFLEYCRSLAGEGAYESLGIPQYKAGLREYMAAIMTLTRLGDRHENSTTIRLAVGTPEQFDRTNRILEALGWKAIKTGPNVRVEPGDQPADSSRLEVLPALGVDAIAMQQALQSGQPFSFEVPSGEASLFGGGAWLGMLKDPNVPGGIAAAFTLDIRLAQTYAALASMPPDAASALAESVGLRNLVTRNSAAAIHYASAFDVAGRAVVVPGGKATEAEWQNLAGAKPADPPAFFRAILNKDQGRFANFYWLMSQADAAHQKFFLAHAPRFYAWYRDSGDYREGLQHDGGWRARLFRELPLDVAGGVHFPGGQRAWTASLDRNPEALLTIPLLEALVPVAELEAKRKAPLDETSARLLAAHYVEWRALFPIFERLPDLEAGDFSALEHFGESVKALPRAQQNLVTADWQSLVQLMALALDAGQSPPPEMFRAICTHLAASDASAQGVALLRQMAGEGDLDDIVPARLLRLSDQRRAAYERVIALQQIPRIASAKTGAQTAQALSGMVYAASLDPNGLLVSEDPRWLAKHRFIEGGLFAEPALVKSNQGAGSYVTGGLINFAALAKNLADGGKMVAIDSAAPLRAVAAKPVGPNAEPESHPVDAVFHADSRLVEVYATITDSAGHYVDDLALDRFSVLDHGTQPKIVSFESRSSEVSVALLLDTTGSMHDALPALKSAALRLIDDLRPADSVAVYSFNTAVNELQSFTTDKTQAKRAVLSTHPYGETALYDALTRVGRDLAGRAGKKVIVLFTDGDDNASTLTTAIAVRRAKAAGIPVYTIAQGVAVTNRAFLDQLAAVSKATGGESFVIHFPQEIKNVFEKISEDLSHGYLLLFQPESTDDPAWRPLEVSVRGVRGAKVRAREGYYPQ